MNETNKVSWYWQDFGNGLLLMSDAKGRPCVLCASGRGAKLTVNTDGRLTQLTADHPTAQAIAGIPDMLRALEAAQNALRSYQHGNSSTELAKDVADHIDSVVDKMEGRA